MILEFRSGVAEWALVTFGVDGLYGTSYLHIYTGLPSFTHALAGTLLKPRHFVW